MTSGEEVVAAANMKIAVRATWVLIVLGATVVGMDLATFAIILPQIGENFSLSTPQLQWVISAFALMYGGLLLLGGRLSDLVGPRRVLLTAVSLGLTGVLTVIFAPSYWTVLVGRGLMGASNALKGPATIAWIVTIFPQGHARNKALSYQSFITSAARAVGAVLAGILVGRFGWRSAIAPFAVFDIGILATILFLLPAFEKARQERKIDYVGAALIILGAGLLFYGLSNLARLGLRATVVWLPGLGGLAALALLIAVERYQKDPLISGRLFTAPNLFPICICTLLWGAGYQPLSVLMSLFLQNVGHVSAQQVSFMRIAEGMVSILAGLGVPILMKRVPARFCLVLGGLGISVGALLMGHLPLDDPFPFAVVLFALTAFPSLLLNVASLSEGLAHAPPDQKGASAGFWAMSALFSSPIGLAIGLPSMQVAAAAHGRLVPGPDDYRLAFTLMAGLTLTAAIFAFFFVRTNPCWKSSFAVTAE